MLRNSIRLLPLVLPLIHLSCGGDPVGPSPEAGPASLGVGRHHVCQVHEQRTVCWGEGVDGQLGFGIQPVDTTPVALPTPPFLVSVTAGATHTCGLDDEGVAWCWGTNSYGELGTGIPNESCGAIPCQTTPTPVGGGHRFQWLTAGVEFTCGLTHGNAVYCWGRNDTGQLGTRDDTTGCDGLRCASLPVLAAGGRTFAAISAGLAHVCGLDAAGNTWCWGYYGLKVTGERSNAEFLPDARPMPGAPRFVRLSSGGFHSCALTAAGTAWCWGIDALGAGPATLESAEPVAVLGDHQFVHIASGRFTACALDRKGAAWCWGPNSSGEVGTTPVGSMVRFDAPSLVSGGFRFTEMTGSTTYCGILVGGGTACWGRGQNGELGSGHVDSPMPVIVPLPPA